MRLNPLQSFLNLFKKGDDSGSAAPAPGFAQALKPSVSLSVLEEKTASFVTGKSSAKDFYGVLSAAFGSNLRSVLPEILANLPDAKASELAKIAK